MRLLNDPADPEDDKGKKKGRWTITRNDDGSYVKRRKNRRGDIIIKKITPIKKNKAEPEKEKKHPTYTKQEEKEGHAAADALINKQKGFAPGTTPRQRIKFRKKKDRQDRKVDRQVIRAERKEEREIKREKKKSYRENKPVKKLKGGNKIVLGGSQESGCSIKGKKSKHRKPCKTNV